MEWKETLNSEGIIKSDEHFGKMEVDNGMEHSDPAKNDKAEQTWNFQCFSGIDDIKETEIGMLADENQSGEPRYVNRDVENAPVMPVTEVCYVAENVANTHGEVKRYKGKQYLKLNSVPYEHTANMELDEDTFMENSEIDGISDEANETDRTSCVCKCHCRRNFQKHGLSKKSKLKSRSYDTNHNSDKLLNHSRRNKTIGVIKANESNQTIFRTRLKSENSSERPSVGISEGRTVCLNLPCIRIRRNMAKILCHCVLIMLLCLCGGVVMVHLNLDKADDSLIHSIHVGGFKTKTDAVVATPEPSILLDVPFRSVSKEVFYKHLSNSKSAAEMLKVFFDDHTLTEEQVNSIMYMKQHQTSNYGSKSMDEGLMMRDEEDELNYRELAYQQYVEFERNPLSDCHEPKPEVVRIEGTASESVLHFLPSCAIVHRCRNSTACCPRGHVCAPKKENGIELIEKFFMVLESVPGSDDLRPAKEFIAGKTLINHTACECQQVEIETNCHKQCPHQFTKTRPGADCECKCATGHRKCHKIHKGLLPLDEKDLECIKEDRCIVPSCHSGEFSISSGFCPHFRRTRKGR